MIKLTRSTVLEHPIDRVWAVLRDFNGHDRWHPAVAQSHLERGRPTDAVGCVRNFRLADGAQLREQLLELSDATATLRYCLLDTPVPLLNYVARIQLVPVTDGNLTFWEWSCQFDTLAGLADQMKDMVGKQIYEAGFAAVARLLDEQAASHHTKDRDS
ncbi:MAG: SRPBCC family protein [Burkholderiaceae bacterium]